MDLNKYLCSTFTFLRVHTILEIDSFKDLASYLIGKETVELFQGKSYRDPKQKEYFQLLLKFIFLRHLRDELFCRLWKIVKPLFSRH